MVATAMTHDDTVALIQPKPQESISLTPKRRLEFVQLNSSRLEIRHDDIPVLWTNKKTKVFSPTQIELSYNDNNVIASAKLKAKGSDALLLLGDPTSAAKTDWINLACESGHYKFMHNDHKFAWSRSFHSDSAKRMSGKEYQLIDETTGSIVMLWNSDIAMVMKGVMAKVNLFVYFEHQLELLALASVLIIDEGLSSRRMRMTAAADAQQMQLAFFGMGFA